MTERIRGGFLSCTERKFVWYRINAPLCGARVVWRCNIGWNDHFELSSLTGKAQSDWCAVCWCQRLSSRARIIVMGRQSSRCPGHSCTVVDQESGKSVTLTWVRPKKAISGILEWKTISSLMLRVVSFRQWASPRLGLAVLKALPNWFGNMIGLFLVIKAMWMKDSNHQWIPNTISSGLADSLNSGWGSCRGWVANEEAGCLFQRKWWGG